MSIFWNPKRQFITKMTCTKQSPSFKGQVHSIAWLVTLDRFGCTFINNSDYIGRQLFKRRNSGEDHTTIVMLVTDSIDSCILALRMIVCSVKAFVSMQYVKLCICNLILFYVDDSISAIYVYLICNKHDSYNTGHHLFLFSSCQREELVRMHALLQKQTGSTTPFQSLFTTYSIH